MVQHSSRCPACGTTLSPAGGSEGLCRACLLEMALESPSFREEPEGPLQAETLVAAEGELTPGSILGHRYRIHSLLGRGGMGEVWRAFDLKLRVDVALKALRTQLLSDDKALEILRQEVRSAREVVSPNVCRVFDLEELDGAELVSMEYVDGTTLREVLNERSPLDLEEAQDIASQFLAGLEAIHGAGLVHRDIKPDNVMITGTGRVVVMDFGVAKALTGAWEGSISGTPAYMSPEHLRGEPLDPRSDVYAAAFVLAEMVDPGGVRTSDSRKRVLDGLRTTPPVVADTPWTPLLEQAVTADRELRQETAAALARALDEITVRAAGDEDLQPYPGLASFTAADAEYFFGRELEIERMWRKLRRPHLLALIGPSGSGKSSFLRAGLLPAMPPGWRILLAKPGNRPMFALGRALVGELPGDSDVAEDLLRFDEPDVAVRLFGRWRRQHDQVLLVVDQFEELFTQNNQEDQERFAVLLRRLSLEADVHVLLTLRDDFLYRCASQEALAPVLSELTLLKTLSGAGLRRALVQPALKCGYRFEDDRLVDEMVAEVSDERGALPLLAFAAAKLWERRDRERGVLVREAYEHIGGVAGALAQHAEERLEAIGPERAPMVRELFRNLVTPDGTRAARERSELLSLFDGAEREAAHKILSELIDARLLTSYDETDTEDEEAGASRVEIIHESLLSAWPRLVRWQTQDADSAQMREQVRRAAAVWDERGRSEDLLWTGAAYREFVVWRDGYAGRLTGTEQAFAEAMTVLAGRQQRRRRLALAATIALLAVGLAIVGGFWRQAKLESRRAEASNLASLGRTVLEEDNSEALAYALASLELSDQESARLLALEALWRGPTAQRPESDQPNSAVFSPDGRWLVVGSQYGRLVLLPREGGPPVAEVKAHESNVRSPRFVTPGLLVSWSLSDGSLRLWRIPGLEPVRSLGDAAFGFRVLPGLDGRPGVVAWEESGAIRWWPVEEGEPVLLGSVPYTATDPLRSAWDVDPTRRYLVYGQGERILRQPLDELGARAPTVIGIFHAEVSAVEISPDGRRIAVSSANEAPLRMWSLEPPFDEIPVGQTPAGPRSMAFSADGTWLAAASISQQFFLLDLEGPPEAEPMIVHRQGYSLGQDSAFSPDGRHLVTVDQGAVDVWPIDRRYPSVLRKEGEVWGAVMTPDGAWIAASGASGDAWIWPARPQQGKWSRRLIDAGPLPTLRVAASPDSSVIGLGTDDGVLWAIAPDGTSVRKTRPFQATLTTIGFAPHGRILAGASGTTQGEDAFIRIWDLDTDAMRDLDPDHGLWITGVRFTPQADRLIESSFDSLAVWDLSTIWDLPEGSSGGSRRLLHKGRTFDGQAAPGDSIVFLEATDHFQGTPRRISLETGVELPIADFGVVGGLTVTPDGLLIGITPEGVLQVGRLEGGRPHLLYGHDGLSITTAVHGEGGDRVILSGGATDGTVRLWPRMPDVDKTPFYLLPHDEVLARLRALTNLRVVREAASETGYRTETSEFPGWEVVTKW